MRRTMLAATIAVVLALLVLHGIAAPLGLLPSLGPPPLGQPGTPPTPPPGTLNPPPAGPSLSRVTVWESTWIDFGAKDRLNLVVQTEAEWLALWKNIRRNPEPPPEVDFGSRTVLVALFGVAGTTGYSIEIKDVVTTSDATLRVLVETMAPGWNCGTGQALTYPVHMVSIPKSDGPFVFEEETFVYSCG